MNTTLTLLDLAGSVALLLWGLHMVQTGVQRAFGDLLRRLLAIALGSRLRAFGCGILVTAVLQSSTATGLMVSGFAGAGLLGLAPALAAMLGANVGTTLIVQLLSFDVSRAASLAILLGVMMFRRSAQTRTRDLGRVAIGLGLMLMALHALLALVTPFEDVPSLRLLLGAIATEPVLAMLAAAVFAWASHSSVATVLLIMSFAARNVVPPHEALAMVLGANLGTAINPLLEGAGGEGGAARRLPLGNLLNRLVGCALALALLDHLGPPLAVLIPDPAREVAIFHTGFNLVMALLFLPLLGPLARLLQRVLPASTAADPGQPIYLGTAEQEAPGVALAGTAREALRMADTLDDMLAMAQQSLDQLDRKRPAELKARHVVLERLSHAIRAYIAELDPDGMSDAECRRARQVTAFAANIENAAAVLARSVAQSAARRLKRGVLLSAPDRIALKSALSRLGANLRTATAVFIAQDSAAARVLVAEKETFRALESAAANAQMAALQGPDAAAADLKLDLLHDIKRINAYLVAAAAYPVLEAEGALRGTRLRDDADA